MKEVKKEVTTVKKQTTTAVANAANKDYKPTVDRTLKGPNSEVIYTSPRGGKYYINKNGNKTYIKREAE
ncbi:hypothetical protein [Pedobacter panaciterrae]